MKTIPASLPPPPPSPFLLSFAFETLLVCLNRNERKGEENKRTSSETVFALAAIASMRHTTRTRIKKNKFLNFKLKSRQTKNCSNQCRFLLYIRKKTQADRKRGRERARSLAQESCFFFYLIGFYTQTPADRKLNFNSPKRKKLTTKISTTLLLSLSLSFI